MISIDRLRDRLLSCRGRLQVLLDPKCKLSPQDAYLEQEQIERHVNECLRLLDASSGKVRPLRSAAHLQ